MEKTTILKVLCGSRAYGLATEDSDYDWHHIYVVPTRELLVINARVKGSQWEEGNEDNIGWELGHFMHLATQCNPTVLETLYAPIKEKLSWVSNLLHDLTTEQAFLSKKRIYDAFRGYAFNQRKKMFEPTGGVLAGERVWKFATAYLRVLWQGEILLQTGQMPVYIHNPVIRKTLLKVKAGEWTEGRIVDLALIAQERLTEAYLASSVPEEADMPRLNEFLWEVRKRFW